MRDAENAVHPTRVSEFGDYLTLPETLLSVAFECVVDATVKNTFALNLTFVATIDYTAQPLTQFSSTGTNGNTGPDVCLGYLYLIPALRYSRWVCINESITARIASPPNTNPAGVQLDHVQSLFSDCGSTNAGKIYGFIESPLAATDVNTEPAGPSWAQQNVLLVLMIFLLAAVAVILCVYCGCRLARYRKKWKNAAEAVDKIKEEVAEMEQFGGTAGTKDDEVEMIQNPMVVQLQSLRENTKTKDEQDAAIRTLEEENKTRQENLAALRGSVEQLTAELERLRGELERQNAAPVRPVIEDFTPLDTAEPNVAAAPDAPSRQFSTQKTAFQSSKPTRKIKDLDSV